MIPGLTAQAALDALVRALSSCGAGVTVVVTRGGREERVYANEPLAKIFGLDPGAMLALPPRAALTPDEGARLAVEQGVDVPVSQRARAMLTKIVRADGTVVPVRLALGYAALDDAFATFVFMRDASDEAETEAALRESEERFRRLAEDCPDFITVIADDRYVYANAAAMKSFGVATMEEFGRIDPLSTMPEHLRGLAIDRARRARRGERLPPMQIHDVDAEGREVVFESSLSFTTFGGRPAFVSYTRDITERMRLRAKLVAQDRLASVGMLAAGVAHELNNPLAALVMQVNHIRNSPAQGSLPDDFRDGVAQIHEAATRMKQIIADLLFLARPADHPQAHVDVGQILASTIALLRAGAARFPPLVADVGELPPVQAYASKLGQVFFNVLANAVQAVADVPGAGVRVRARHVDDAIDVVIEDDGPGITPEVAARIGQPFFTTKPDGTGLGLWISHTLVAQHGGSLDVHGVVGRGTIVTIRLPLTPAIGVSTPPYGAPSVGAPSAGHSR